MTSTIFQATNNQKYFFRRNERSRVARWYIFKPKIQIWAKFGGSSNGGCWYVLCPFGIFHSHWVYSMAIWYILRIFYLFFPFCYVVARKLWQPWRSVKGLSNKQEQRVTQLKNGNTYI
jgi:hypothetical protein